MLAKNQTPVKQGWIITLFRRLDAYRLARGVLWESWHIGRKLNPVLLGTRPAMKHGYKAVGIIHRTCLQVGHVRLTGNCRVNRRATGATEITTDRITGIRVTVLIEGEITDKVDIRP